MKRYSIALALSIIAIFAYYIPQILNPEVELRRSRSEAPKNSKRTRRHSTPKVPVFDFKMPAKGALQSSVQQITGLTGSLSIDARIDLVHDLKNKTLKAADFEALFTFLKARPKVKVDELHWHSLKNEIMIFTINDGRFKESQAKILEDIVLDDSQNEILREYVLQYIPEYFQKQWQGKTEYSPIDRQIMTSLVAMLWQVQDEKSGPIAGTALIALHDLSPDFDLITAEQVKKGTRKLLRPSTPEASRMAAFSIAKERSMSDVLPLAEEVCFDDAESVSLRMAALNTAFSLQPNEDFFEKVKTFGKLDELDPRLKRAAAILIKRNNK